MSMFFAATSIGNAEAREAAVDSVARLIARPIDALVSKLSGKKSFPRVDAAQ